MSTARALALGTALLAGALLLAFGLGRYPVAPAELLRALTASIGVPGVTPVDDTTRTVLLGVRGPRVLAAVLVGAALAAAGSAFQALFRNPLVSPDILGASAGAALGAMLGIFLALGETGTLAAAFAGGLLAVALAWRVGAAARSVDPLLGLLLAGLVIGALLAAAIGLLKVLADPFDQLPAMTFWLLGSLAASSPATLLPLTLAVAAGGALLLALRWRLDALSLPEDEARALGVPVLRLRLLVIAAATLVTAASVAAAGIVGWVGLVVPHLARLLAGPGFARLLPLAALLGGGLLLLADTAARTLAGTEIPLGIVTALVGAPCFLWLLLGTRRGDR